MDIILKGQHTSKELVESLENVLKLFKEQYQVSAYCEIRLSVTLIDDQNDTVELVDSESNQVFRSFEVYRSGYELNGRLGVPQLQLVVDNTR